MAVVTFLDTDSASVPKFFNPGLKNFQIKNWVIGFVFPITACTASASAVVFFRLLESLSYVHFDLLKLMQVSLL